MKTYCVKCRKRSKDLVKRTQSDKVLKDKAFKIASNQKYDGYQRGLASMIYMFFDKTSKGSGISTSLANKSAKNQIINWQMHFINQLLENVKKEKFIHHLEIIFGVLI